MNRKNILFYYMNGDSDGGSDYSLYAHLSNLNDQKYNPTIIYRKESKLVECIKDMGYKAIAISDKKKQIQGNIQKHNKKTRKNFPFKKYLSSLKLFYKSIPEALLLKKIIKEEEIELLHLNHNLNGDRSGIVAGILSRVIIISHYRGLHKPLPVDILLSRFIDKLICISDFTKDEYTSEGINKNKCITIYNGVDTDVFSPVRRKSEKIIIGCIGRLEEWKGQQVLLNAIPEILNIYPKAQFQFIGDGNNKKKLMDLSDSLNISKSVDFIGSITNIKDYINEFTLAVHTSIEPEPFGRVIIEAMSMKKTVISTNIGGPKEIISNNVDGFLIEPNSPEKLSKIIIEVLKDEQLCLRVGEEARRTVESKFKASLTTAKIEEIYSIK